MGQHRLLWRSQEQKAGTRGKRKEKEKEKAWEWVGQRGEAVEGQGNPTDLATMLVQNPSAFPLLLQQIRQSNPQLYQLAQQNPQAFMQLLLSQRQQRPQQRQRGIQVTPEEREAINRVPTLATFS